MENKEEIEPIDNCNECTHRANFPNIYWSKIRCSNFKSIDNGLKCENFKLKVKCELFDLCRYKFIIRPNKTILKEEDLDIKYHCGDLKSLEDSYAYCTIRMDVFKALGDHTKY